MKSSSAESKQRTSQQGPSITEGSEFVLHQYGPVPESDLLMKHRRDDAVFSSTTHGSISSAGTSRRQISDLHTGATQTSNVEVEDHGEDTSTARESSPKSANRAHMFNVKPRSTNYSSTEDLSYCLDRFVRDIYPQEKARLGKLDNIDRGRSRERRKDGAGRWREPRLKSRERRYDHTRVD
jgi:hypothetical protein